MIKIEVYITDSDDDGMHQIVVRRVTMNLDGPTSITVLRCGVCNWPEAIVKTLYDAGMTNTELYSISDLDFENCLYENSVLIPRTEW